MYRFEPFIKYEYNGRVYENSRTDCENYRLELKIDENGISCKLVPHVKMKLIEFNLSAIKKFAEGELFFANGFQSWTTTKEYGADETVKGILGLAGITGLTKDLAVAPGDYNFTDYGKKGSFHSFTYTYFRLGDEIELFGSLSEKVGYTIFSVNYAFNKFMIKKDVEGSETEDELMLL